MRACLILKQKPGLLRGSPTGAVCNVIAPFTSCVTLDDAVCGAIQHAFVLITVVVGIGVIRVVGCVTFLVVIELQVRTSDSCTKAEISGGIISHFDVVVIIIISIIIIIIIIIIIAVKVGLVEQSTCKCKVQCRHSRQYINPQKVKPSRTWIHEPNVSANMLI